MPIKAQKINICNNEKVQNIHKLQRSDKERNVEIPKRIDQKPKSSKLKNAKLCKKYCQK